MRPTIDEQAEVRHLMLKLIAGDGGLIELRCFKGGLPRHRSWHDDPAVASRRAGELAVSTDVYAGVLPRFEREGGRTALRFGRLLWVDCDNAEAVNRLRVFRPAPTFVLRSGGADGGVPKLHAWWLMDRLWAPDAVERGNKRLALALAADPAVYDAPRIMRLPGTLNHKSELPRPVVCEWVGDGHTSMAALIRDLPDPEMPSPCRPARLVDRNDELATISPQVYVPALSGREVNRNQKVKCPLHDERTPSLHVYPEPERGWFCFGCRQGGDVYTFAARLWGLDSHADFPEVRDRLRHALGLRRAA